MILPCSVPEIIIKKLGKNPLYIELLKSNLININALAGGFCKEIYIEYKYKASLPTVSMAIRRYIKKLPKIKTRTFPKHIDITTRTGIYEMALPVNLKSKRIAEKIKQSIKSTDFISIAEGSYEIVIFTNQSNREIVRKIIGNTKFNSEVNNLSYVTVNWPPITKEIPGIYYRITGALAHRGISIQSFHTIGSEMMIFIAEADLAGAYDGIKGIL